MKIDRTGLILYVLKYQECIDFYQNILQFPIMFTSENLTCFEFGASYLMVELDDEYFKSGASEGRIRTCIRMNVSDVKSISNRLKANEIEVDYQEKSWGTVAKFFDPDGNLCAFKDSPKFEEQILDHKGK
jgi:lactoylglutathione lyase